MNKKIDFFYKNNENDKPNNSTQVKMLKTSKTRKNMAEIKSKNMKEYFGSKSNKKTDANNPITNNTYVNNNTAVAKLPQKRRGRRPKKIVENLDINVDDKIETINDSKNDSAVILRLPIDPEKLPGKHQKKNAIIERIESDIDSNDSESSDGMFRNDIPKDSVCHKCAKNEKLVSSLQAKLEKYEKKDKIDKSNKIYHNKLNFISIITGNKIILKKTNSKCWWDCDKFSNLPFFLPELYHNNTYYVMGCFCSFNCALAYNLYYLKDSKVNKRKSLVYSLYKEMYDLGPDDVVEIKEAPPREKLADFLGELTIEEFRQSFIMMNKENIVYIPPIKPMNIIIEERTIFSGDTNDNDNDKELVLKRSKPITKRRSIISSMKMNIADDDD